MKQINSVFEDKNFIVFGLSLITTDFRRVVMLNKVHVYTFIESMRDMLQLDD